MWHHLVRRRGGQSVSYIVVNRAHECVSCLSSGTFAFFKRQFLLNFFILACNLFGHD